MCTQRFVLHLIAFLAVYFSSDGIDVTWCLCCDSTSLEFQDFSYVGGRFAYIFRGFFASRESFSAFSKRALSRSCLLLFLYLLSRSEFKKAPAFKTLVGYVVHWLILWIDTKTVHLFFHSFLLLCYTHSVMVHKKQK